MTLTLAQITEKAAQHVCERNGIEKHPNDASWVTALAWNTNVYIEEEDAFREIVSAAIQIAEGIHESHALNTPRVDLMVAAIKADQAQVKTAFLVFTGPYEIHYTLDAAEERLEELLDAGHASPTTIKVELTEKDGTEVLGLTARKVIDTATEGEIR